MDSLFIDTDTMVCKKKVDFIINEEYIKCYKGKEEIQKAFEIALETRKFEIELYWKRTAYFALFIGAVFVGYYSILSPNKTVHNGTNLLPLILVVLGYLLSLLWYMANRGSKYWQENWEAHIEELSTHLGIPIFGIIKSRKHSIWNLREEYPFSVSKVNQMVSLIITFGWLMMLLKEIGIFDFLKITSDGIIYYKAFVVIFVIAMSILIINFCKGFAAKKPKEGDEKNVAQYFWNYDSCQYPVKDSSDSSKQYSWWKFVIIIKKFLT